MFIDAMKDNLVTGDQSVVQHSEIIGSSNISGKLCLREILYFLELPSVSPYRLFSAPEVLVSSSS